MVVVRLTAIFKGIFRNYILEEKVFDPKIDGICGFDLYLNQ